MERIKKPKGWKWAPAAAGGDSLQKYCGLRNLGCICYMNSMMQQFFMVAPFRYNLMCVDDGVAANPQKHHKQSDLIVDDNMLHQIQKLVAHLELSQRTEYNPTEFCFSYKEFDGKPCDTSEQKDAQEFLNVLFDRLETHLKPTKRKYLLQSIFAGKTCSQMVCTECGKVKNRIEDYYNLSVDIGPRTLEESLAQLIAGETISDYNCSGCKKKVDVSKRMLIAETPSVLIVHLKRLVFNFDTFRNDKVNTFLEFPTSLDLRPYSYHEVMKKEGLVNEQKEGDEEEEESPQAAEEEREKNGDESEEEENPIPIVDDCFEYKLVGMNIHSGTANAGHYWSYINTERTSVDGWADEDWMRSAEEPWCEYNDSRVSDWKVAEKMKEDCFGDEDGAGRQGYFGGGYGKSAYMLFYERRAKKPIKILVPEEEVAAAKEQGVEVHHDEQAKEHYKHVPYHLAVDKEPPNQIWNQVSEDNGKFTFETDVYSESYFGFIKSVL
jgi:uncharacterized UBP type Zn finger protein